MDKSTDTNQPSKPDGKKRRQRGVAILTVLVSLALLGATTADLAYNAQVEMEAAANSRDMLRAEYLATSGIELAKLLIAVQGGLQGMLQSLPPEIRDNLVITDFAGFLAQAFGGDKEARDGLGALVGIDLGSVEGMGTPKGTSFDLQITSEEGKYPINCGGGNYDQTNVAKRKNLYLLLDAMIRPTRFDRLFNVPDRDGMSVTREDFPVYIIDWLDQDITRYSVLAGGGASEETYDKGRDRYEPHNHYFDTIEEMIQVRGVSEELWGNLGDMFTVYGSDDCKVMAAAIEPSAWPLLAGILAASAADKTAVFDPNTAFVAQQLAGMLKSALPMLKGMSAQLGNMPPCKPDPRCPNQQPSTTQTKTTTTTTTKPAPAASDNIETLANLICSDAITKLPQMSDMITSFSGTAAPPKLTTPLRPIALCPGMLSNFLRERGPDPKRSPRRFFRIDATGNVQRTSQKNTQVHIRGVWDAQARNGNPICFNHPSCNSGTWLYYRLD